MLKLARRNRFISIIGIVIIVLLLVSTLAVFFLR